MRKILILFILLFNCWFLIGQNSTVNPKLPEITNPSTEAYSFTKYGNLPLNEFLGMPNVSVPIYEYKAHKINVPISLNYSGNGVKVNEYPTKTGISWTLNAGGLITRVIKDRPDEQTIGTNYRQFKTSEQYNSLNTADGTFGASTLVSFIENSEIDTEADIFHYNFMGYSGSFILDENYTPHLLKEESELKISIIGDLRIQKQFLIITPDGTKYHFGGVNAVENSINSSVDRDIPIGDTAYYLTKIEHPEYGEVYFEYITILGSIVPMGYSESKTFLVFDNFPSCRNLIIPSSEINYFNNIQRTANVRLISKISSNCNSEAINFYYLNFNGKKILDKIEIENNINNTVNLLNRIKLSYIGLDNFGQDIFKKRFFLSSVQFNEQIVGSDEKKEKWEFEYDNPFELPDRLSYAVDKYGYYNGKISNTTFLSTIWIPHQYAYANNYIYEGADKNSDFDFAKKGTLIKIKYPTKGHTIIEYESNPLKEDVYTQYSNYINSSENINHSSIPGLNNLNDEVIILPSIFKTQTVKVNYTFNSSDFLANHFVKVNIKVKNLTDNSIIHDQLYNIGINSSLKEFQVLLVKDKQYKFEISFFNPQSIVSGTYVNAWLRFKLLTDVTTTQGDGLRVKKIIDYDTNNSQASYKRFYYLPLNFIYLPIEQQPIKYQNLDKYFKYSMVWKIPLPCSLLSAFEARYTTLVSNPFFDYFNLDGFSNIINPVVVTSFGGDNFENGGVQKVYHTDINFSQYSQNLPQNYNALNDFNTNIAENDFATSISNNSDISGDIIKEYYFKKVENSFYKITQTNTNYFKTKTPAYVNLVGKKVFDIVFYPEENSYQPGTSTSNFYLKIYSTLAFRNILNSVEKITYIDNVSMPNITFNQSIENDDMITVISEPDETNIKKIVTTQTFEYGALKGLPTVITSSTSDTNTVNKTINTYVNSVSNLTGLPANQSTLYTSLLALNRVDSPIQTQQFQNTELLSTQRTLFKNWTIGSTTKILPEKIQISKGIQPLEDKAFFYNYDSQFNPVVMGYKDGTKTRYIFNSEGLVVAKIENYTGTDTTFPLITGNIDNASCNLQTQYPNALVTVFNYNLITRKLIKITDSNCRNTFYEYDNLQRLKFIKDHEGNILKEFDHNYKN